GDGLGGVVGASRRSVLPHPAYGPIGPASFGSPHVGVHRNGPAALHVDVERDRLHAGNANLDLVRPGGKVQVPLRTVEVLGDADVVAVDEDLCVARRSLDPYAAVDHARLRADIAGRRRRTAVGVRVIRV